jgi:hypothetical protein
MLYQCSAFRAILCPVLRQALAKLRGAFYIPSFQENLVELSRLD